jgi:ribosomal protein S12 methylthiotransferase accessory factor
MYTMTSSLRTRSLEATYALASEYSAICGVTRVTDTTWLDDIGIPVYASIRPNAYGRSLCVHNGKGSLPMEAKVGALMEAIEFSLASPGSSSIAIGQASVHEILTQPDVDFTWLDLCPLYGRDPVTPTTQVRTVVASLLGSDAVHILPAELVFHPLEYLASQPQVFGTSTNGLASGNTVNEATLHGLLEVLERDIRSYNFIRNTSCPVVFDSDDPPEVTGLVERIRAAGYPLRVRSTSNRFGLPFFEAFLLEPNPESPIAVAVGTGIHLKASVAAVRAISEAAQSRLTHIHGGRDDIIDRHDHFELLGKEHEHALTRQLIARVSDETSPISFKSLARSEMTADTIEGNLDLLIATIQSAGLGPIYRVVLTPEDAPVAVVRLIVPGAEFYKPEFRRMGPGIVRAIVEASGEPGAE